MSRSALGRSELPAILVAVIIIVMIQSGYLDRHQWVIWLIIAAIPAWVILGRRKANTV